MKTYRSALNQELIRRRAGKYGQAWLAERLSISVRTLQRYIKLTGIQCQQIFYTTEITPDNIHQTPTKYLAKRAGITIQYCFLQDVTGKCYPPIQAIARKLLRQGVPVHWMRRGWNIYWIGDKTSQPYIVFMPEIEHVFNTLIRTLIHNRNVFNLFVSNIQYRHLISHCLNIIVIYLGKRL